MSLARITYARAGYPQTRSANVDCFPLPRSESDRILGPSHRLDSESAPFRESEHQQSQNRRHIEERFDLKTFNQPDEVHPSQNCSQIG